MISKMLLRNFIEIPLWHVCSPVNLLYILRTPFHKNFSEDCLWISKSAPSSKSYNTEEILEIIWKLDDDSTISSVVETNSDNCQSGSPETPKHYQVQRRVWYPISALKPVSKMVGRVLNIPLTRSKRWAKCRFHI